MFSFIKKCRIYCPQQSLLKLFLVFFGIFRPKSKIESSHLFVNTFAWCLVLLCKLMNQNSKFFRIKGELNTPLNDAKVIHGKSTHLFFCTSANDLVQIHEKRNLSNNTIFPCKQEKCRLYIYTHTNYLSPRMIVGPFFTKGL